MRISNILVPGPFSGVTVLGWEAVSPYGTKSHPSRLVVAGNLQQGQRGKTKAPLIGIGPIANELR